MKKKNRLQRFIMWMKPPGKGFWIMLVLFAILTLGVYLYNQKDIHQELTITELVQKISHGEVDRIVVVNSTMFALRKGELQESYKTYVENNMTAGQMLRTYGLTDAEFKRLSIKVEDFRFSFGTFMTILELGLFLLMFGSVVLLRVAPQLLSGSVGKKANTDASTVKTKFSDIAGNVAAKRELREIVDFLKNPEKYTKLGALIPKGALLKGPPGTGKTQLARAVAGETGVPFFYISGSEFIELYVGVGPARVREIFKKAKKESPSIIFIDEIDAIGQTRQSRGSNSEDDKTLNQLLTEMEGFDDKTNVIVIGATNNPDTLDPALLRRLERQIYVSLPDVNDRLAILKIKVTGKPMAEDVNLEAVAKRTQGLSGDALTSLINEAAIRAAEADQSVIMQKDLLSSIEKVLLGSADRRIVSDKEKDVIAYHEAGHAVITMLIASNSDIQKVTIASQGNRGGFVMNSMIEENILHSREEFINQMAIAFGGYAAEEHFIGDVTNGAADDLKKINALARVMVSSYGMGKSLGYLVEDENHYLSDKYQQMLDEDMQAVINEAAAKAEALIADNADFVSAVRGALLEKEAVEQAELLEIAARFKKGE